MSLRTCLVVTTLLAACTATSLGGEVRTYRFVGDTPAYYASSDGFAWLPNTTRSRLEGTFNVQLDPELGVGALLSLDARLTHSEGLYSDGFWRPYGEDRVFSAVDRLYGPYRLPLSGTLSAAEYRPSSSDTPTFERLPDPSELSAQATALGLPLSLEPYRYSPPSCMTFPSAPPGAQILLSDGLQFNAEGLGWATAPGYSIYFEGEEASFSFLYPAIDLYEGISSARAVLVPEPAAIGLGMVCIGVSWALLRRRRLSHCRVD